MSWSAGIWGFEKKEKLLGWTVKTSVASAAALAAVFVPATAHAHPGPHEGDAAGLLHAVTQPDHLLALLMIGAAVLWAARLVGRVRTLLTRRTAAARRVVETTDVR